MDGVVASSAPLTDAMRQPMGGCSGQEVVRNAAPPNLRPLSTVYRRVQASAGGNRRTAAIASPSSAAGRTWRRRLSLFVITANKRAYSRTKPRWPKRPAPPFNTMSDS